MIWPFPKHQDHDDTDDLRTPRPGAGTRLTVNELGAANGAPPVAPPFQFPWRPTLSGMQVTFGLGLINTFIPTINGKPMISAPNGAAVPLKLDPTMANANGESWVCVDVYPKNDGTLDLTSRIEIVQARSDDTISHELTRGRKGICLVLWQKKLPMKVIPAVHWNMTYERQVPPAGQGTPKHRFY